MKKNKKKRIILPTEDSFMAKGFDDLISLFYGPPGAGKTTFVKGLAENVLFLSTDRGTRNLKTKRIEAFTWDKCLKVMDALEDEDAPHYDIFCIDHVDDFCGMAEQFVLEKYDVDSLTDRKLPYGKGWKEYKDQMKSYINRILRLGSTPVFIAHETIKSVKTDGQELDKFMPSLGKTAWGILIPTIDIIGFITVKRIKEGNKRFDAHMLKTQPTQDIYGKDRSRRIKPPKGWEPLDPEAFLRSFSPKGRRARKD